MATGIVCPHCGLVNHPQRRTCHQCHGDLTAAPVPVSTTPIILDDRKAILEQEIGKQVAYGWRVGNRTDTSVQLVKDKETNGCLLLFLFCLGIVPGLIYMATSRGQEGLYLEVDEYGRVRRTMGN